MSRFSSSLLIPLAALALVPSMAWALNFESDDAMERAAFPSVPLSSQTTNVDDPVGDLTVLDRKNRKIVPPLMLDVNQMSVTPGAAGWTVTFSTTVPIPADPRVAVNYQVFVKRADLPTAKNGVYRADSNLAALLLYGSRTRWHSQLWAYDGTQDRWNLEKDSPQFTVNGTQVSLTLPYSVLPQNSTDPIRALALTSTGGLTAVDLVPGDNLPPIQKRYQPSAPAAASTPSVAGSSIALFIIVGFGIIFSLLVMMRRWMS